MSLKRKAADQDAANTKKPKANSNITSFFGAPKTPEFDKTKWVNGLTDEQKQLLKLEIGTLHESWLSYLKDEITSPGFMALKRFLKKEEESKQKIFPPADDVYSW